MKVNISRLRKLAYGALAVVMLSLFAVPALSGRVAAYTQVTVRSIQMSNSANGATNTIYKVTFTTAATQSVGAIDIDFCSNTPIIGDTCTAPAGFSIAKATLSINNQSCSPSTCNGSANPSLTVDTTNSVDTVGTTEHLVLTRTSNSISSGTTITFELGNGTTNGITNPTTTNLTFYARISTVAATNGTGTALDAGGIALSTAAVITVTAKVQETLTFCVYTGVNCAAGGVAVALGDTNGVLSTTGSYVDVTTKYDIATNAGGASPGATIRFKAPLPTSGANTIATIGTTATTAAASNTSLFGLCSNITAGSATVLAPYAGGTGVCSAASQSAGTGTPAGATGTQFAFNTANAASTYGESLATTNAGASSTGRIAYVGQTSTTQAAGIYTSPFTFIATATY